jgi:hypothetical protein
MIDHITPIDRIKQECVEIQYYLEITVSDEIAEIEERGNTISVHMARSSKLLADAKYYQDDATQRSIEKHCDRDLSPSVFNKLILADCKEENYYVNWLERINRTATHQMEWLRSVMSKAKQEMANQNWGNPR